MQQFINNNSVIKAKKSTILKHFWKSANMNNNNKKKDENLIDDLEKSFSDNDYNDEIESDNESNE